MARAGRCVDLCRRLFREPRPAARRLLHRAESGGGALIKRGLIPVTPLARLAPASAFARGEFDPTTEFEQHDWIPIHLGPIDMSITKAVAYLMLGTVLTMLLGWGLMRWKVTSDKDVTRRQSVGEMIYEVAQVQ